MHGSKIKDPFFCIGIMSFFASELKFLSAILNVEKQIIVLYGFILEYVTEFLNIFSS